MPCFAEATDALDKAAPACISVSKPPPFYQSRHRISHNFIHARPVTIPILQIESLPLPWGCSPAGEAGPRLMQRDFRNGSDSAVHMQWSRIRVQRSDLPCMGFQISNLKSQAPRTHRAVAETLRSGWCAGSAAMQSRRSIPRAGSRAPGFLGDPGLLVETLFTCRLHMEQGPQRERNQIDRQLQNQSQIESLN